MHIAQKKRRENIAEYILYLWQMEDMLRALKFSPEAIRSQLVEPCGFDPDKADLTMTWYLGIADLLKQEGKQGGGHMSHTLHLVADLQRFHEQLMELPVGERYRALFARLEPELPRLREVMGREDMSDMELAFRALYAVMLYRMKGDTAGEKAAGDVIDLISPVVAELAHVYRQVEAGETDLFKGQK